MKNKASRLPYEMPQDPDWLFHQPNLSPEVINETMNMRTIRFSQHKSLNLRFTEKTRNNFKRGPFVSLEELYSFLFISREKRKCILHFCFPREKRKHILSLVFQGEKRETSHKENKKIKKTFLFIFNSGSFQIVLKLPETVPSFSHLFGLGRVSSLGHSNLTLTLKVEYICQVFHLLVIEAQQLHILCIN